jgi:uncharacterized repeat protein (TIGR01451 family)
MKIRWSYWKSLLYAAGFLALSTTTTNVFADGTETLGPPSIPIATGSGIQAAGVGLAAAQPGTININVPAGATVKQVLLYWSGVSTVVANLDNTITIEGNSVTGTALSAAPTLFTVGGQNRYIQAYRADITALELVSAGANSLSVGGLDFQFRNDGAGIMVIFDEGGAGSDITVRDGNDFAFFSLPPPLDTTVPQTIAFAASNVERTATLKMFFADVAGQGSGNGFRPSVIEVTSGGVTTEYPNLLDSNDGEEWDTVMLDVAIPAGATSLTVQALSKDLGVSEPPCDQVPNPCGQPASFIWLAAGLSVPGPNIDIEKFTNGYDADAANGFPILTPPPGPGFPGDVGGNQVPVVKIGDDITWTYVVTNNGSETLTNIMVMDSKGVDVVCPSNTLAPGASFTCTAMGTGLDLSVDPTSVAGCGSQGQGMTVPTYENLGMVVGFGATSGVEVTDEDPSHYCNPPGVLIEKFTNGWDGDFANGIPTPGLGNFNPLETRQVAEIPIGDDITWTYVVTNTSSETLINVSVTDDRGVTVTCPADTLAPGASFRCTAMGTAADLQPGDPNVAGCGSGTGETRPTYENLGMVKGTGETTGVLVEDDDPSHYCNPPPPPPCGLTVQKGCEIPPPPPSADAKCDGKLKQFTVVWNGAGPIDIAVGEGLSSSSKTSVMPGDEVTFTTDGSTNDTIVNISGAVSGQSTFHVSCSDEDMDGDTSTNKNQQQVSPIGRDCGKFQGNGKGSTGINDWLLEGFVDKSNAVLDCTSDPGLGVSSCEFQAVAADCDFPNKDPDTLTFRVAGGDCSDSDNAQKPDKTECTGGFINPNQSVQVSVNGGTAFTLEPGGSFDVERGGDPEIELTQGNVTQFNKFHASCSQPLQAGDRYGANELLALDGAGLGTNVVYSYLVSNQGLVPVTDITVGDNKLGLVGSIASLLPGDSDTVTATAFISQTTTNIATVDGVGPPNAVCASNSNPVVVTVSPPPPCDTSIAFKELKDDAIKWTLTNNATQRKATMESFTLVFPAAFGLIKEVKLDGAVFKASDSSTFPNGVASGQTIGPDDWTELEVAKRQLDQGEDRTLEVKFTQQDKNASQGEFDLNVTFKEGCMVSF